MSKVYLSTAYLASIQYYAKLYSFEKVCIESDCNYVKQTFRNRCMIGAANGAMPLSIPIEKPDSPKCKTRDIRIAEHGNWRHLHWNAISSAYNSTPFFEYYKDDFVGFYEKKYDFLFDYNEQLREMICSLIDFTPNVSYSHEYQTVVEENAIDLREKISPKKPFDTWDNEFKAIPYYQVFQQKHGFLPNLSIIDLLFNMGPESLLILRDSSL
ncbi:MAG: WbqC family protein [Tannerellaceae bacterium]